MGDQYEGSNQGYDEGTESQTENRGEEGMFDSATSRVKEAVGNVTHTVKDQAQYLKDQAQHGIDQLRSAASSARGQGERAYREVQTQVGQRPMTYVVTALAAGVLLGALITHLYEGHEERY